MWLGETKQILKHLKHGYLCVQSLPEWAWMWVYWKGREPLKLGSILVGLSWGVEIQHCQNHCFEVKFVFWAVVWNVDLVQFWKRHYIYASVIFHFHCTKSQKTLHAKSYRTSLLVVTIDVITVFGLSDTHALYIHWYLQIQEFMQDQESSFHHYGLLCVLFLSDIS